MSIVSAPLQQGQAPTNTQTRIHNNTLKVASVGGGQNAVYHVVGGPISDNVTLSLPAVSSDDTIATLGANNSWTGQHSFASGLNASGPINSTAPITTSSSITGSSIFSQGGITSNGAIVANGDLTVVGNFNPANLSTPGNLSVGTAATITGAINAAGTTNTGHLTVTGNHTVTATVNLSTVTGSITSSGPHQFNAGLTIGPSGSGNNLVHNANTMYLNPNHAFSSGTGHMQCINSSTNSSPGPLFGIQTGGANSGLIIATSAAQAVGFFLTGGRVQAATQQPSHGSVFAGVSYTTTTENMIDDCYEALRNYGLLA